MCPPFVSVIVPTHRRREMLRRLLESLCRLSYPRDRYEIVVVGDMSFDDGTEQMVKSFSLPAALGLQFVKSSAAAPSAKRNMGLRYAKGGIVGFTDDDCIVHEDWITRAVSRFSDESTAGVYGQTGIPCPSKPGPSYYHATGLARPGYQTCNIFYRKAVVEEVGGFDERFMASCREDSDLAFTLLEKGHVISFEPEVVVDHPVREGEPWDLIKSARRGCWDPLLFKKHPRLYGANIGGAFPNSYRVFYLLSTAAAAALALRDYSVLALLLFSYLIFLFWQASRHLNKARFSLLDWSVILVSLLVSPYILLGSVLKGNLKYRSLLWR